MTAEHRLLTIADRCTMPLRLLQLVASAPHFTSRLLVEIDGMIHLTPKGIARLNYLDSRS